MAMPDLPTDFVPISRFIYIIRGQRVMLSTDLAQLYGVEVRSLVQAVKRNRDRFPEDFMFQLSFDEVGALKSQNVTSSTVPAQRANPYAFTEQGVAMLSSVLRSKCAIEVNIAIMRAFVQLRRWQITNKELAQRLDEIEQTYDSQIKTIVAAINRLTQENTRPKRRIGFRP